jgi:hypothetical protein
MSTFIEYDDFLVSIKERILDLLIDDSDTALASASADAQSYITDRLADRYDIAAEFAKTGTDRNNTLLSWMRALILYAIYARVPDNQVPERVIKDYDDTRTELEKIQQSKLGCSLKRLADCEGETISRFRMGSNNPRSHDPYELI